MNSNNNTTRSTVRIDDSIREQVKVLSNKGYKLQAIADELNISLSSVKRFKNSKTKISNVLNNSNVDSNVVPDVSYEKLYKELKAKYDDLEERYEIQEAHVHYLKKNIEYLQWRNGNNAEGR